MDTLFTSRSTGSCMFLNIFVMFGSLSRYSFNTSYWSCIKSWTRRNGRTFFFCSNKIENNANKIGNNAKTYVTQNIYIIICIYFFFGVCV